MGQSLTVEQPLDVIKVKYYPFQFSWQFRSYRGATSTVSTALRLSISRSRGCLLIVDDRAGLGLGDRDVGDRPLLFLRLLDDCWLLVELRTLLWCDDLRRDGLQLLPPVLLPLPLRPLALLPREVDLLYGLLLLLSRLVLRLDVLLLLLSGVLFFLDGLPLRGACVRLSSRRWGGEQDCVRLLLCLCWRWRWRRRAPDGRMSWGVMLAVGLGLSRLV